MRFVLAFLWLVAAAHGAFATGLFPGGTPKNYGQVATRSATPNIVDTTNKYLQTQSVHIARSNTRRFQIAISNWYVLTGEITPGGTSTAVVDVLVDGVCTSVTFSGSSTATLATGDTTFSDYINVPLTAGAQFKVFIGINNNSNLVYGGLPVNTALGDAMTLSTSPITYTPCSTVTNTPGNLSLYVPTAIVGETTVASVCGTGDSRMLGTGDTVDSSGNVGNTFRSVGAAFGYIVSAVGGNSTFSFTAANSPRRINIINRYCTHYINEMGGANINAGGQTGAQVIVEIQRIWAMFPSKRVFQPTMEPDPSTSNGCIDLAGQTLHSYAPDFVTVNTFLRTTPAPLVQYFEVANVVETTQNSGFWKTSPQISTDCRHENQAGYLAVQAAGVIPTSAFTFP